MGLGDVHEVVVIGAGMAGISCARVLADAGRDVLVIDKGRGLGGRMASRRTDHGPLDHGAPWFEASRPAFAAAIKAMARAGCVAPWRGAHVGLPGMSGALRRMAGGIERRQGWEVTEVRRLGGAWLVRAWDDAVAAREVITTVPLPQAKALVGQEVGRALNGAEMSPCWTLLAFADEPVEPIRDGGDVAWLSDEGSKPGRVPGGIVLQASAEWSRPRIEMDREEARAELLKLLAEVGPRRVHWASAHRWRHSRAERPLGRPFVSARGLRVGGDWCLGSTVEAAWESGTAMARDLLLAKEARAS